MWMLLLGLLLLPVAATAQVNCWNPSGSYVTCTGPDYTFEATGKLGQGPVNYWDNKGNSGLITGNQSRQLVYPNPPVAVPNSRPSYSPPPAPAPSPFALTPMPPIGPVPLPYP